MDGKPPRRPRIECAALVALVIGGGAAVGQVVLPPTVGVPAGIGAKPTAGHDAALASLAQGDLAGALELANDEYAGCTKFGNQRWIDSIAGAAIVGECHYERGDFTRAVVAYDEALAIAAQHPEWLLAAQFPAQPPRPAAGRRAATWGRSTRNTMPAQLPDVVAIRMQGADPQEVLQRGGVLAAPFDLQVRPQEIMRALVVALYRRAEIMGPLGHEAASVDAVARALARRPAPPNHWSQSWIDIAHGTALWAQGKADQATPLLTRGLTMGQGLDHPLTPWGLIVLGRIALDADRAVAAAGQFEEATYAAADFGDARALEEGFRLAFAAHMLAGARGVPPTIRAAADAITPRDGLDVLRVRLLAMSAEALAGAGDARAATAALKEIAPRTLRDLGPCAAAAEAAYAAAVALYASGDVAGGDADLDRALGLARPRSTTLFRTGRLVELVNAGSSVSDRQAETLFASLLGPPAPRDFGLDPLGTLAAITTPRQEAFDAWIAVAARRGVERASDAVLDPAEAARRDRWLTARPLGGRLVAAQRLLTADPESLAPGPAARRAAIVAARRDLGPLLEGLGRQRAALAGAALAAGRPADGAAPRAPAGAAADWAKYRDGAEGLARHVAALAAGRDAVTIDFPPLTPSAEIRRRLGERQFVLSFHWTARGLTGVLESRDRFAIWEVRQAAGLPAEIAHLARGLCLFDAGSAVGTDKLLASDWRGPASRIERMLFENSRVSLADGVDELVIVPEGWLWYVPFELLPVASARADAAAARPRPLGEACRIRYCPTRSLAVADFPAPRMTGPVGIHAGRLARADDAAAVEALLARTTAAIDRAVPVTIPAGGPPGGLVASVFDALAVFDESSGAVLVPSAAGKGGLAFPQWLAPPAKRPQVVLVPGLQTAMADGLREKSLPQRPGDDLFLPATDLLAAGAHTAVLARWRVGGGTCTDLMTEFLREATAAPAEPPDPAAALWRRAVDLATAACPDPHREPRLRQQGDAVLPDARHPFLWAGYMLVDCGPGRPPAAGAAPAANPRPGAAP